ncbi:MAG: DUF6091 family protein [Gammaproteobacteria bacterium]|nr:DUF6091 family protein [Gammaproteobacteria bacterium]
MISYGKDAPTRWRSLALAGWLAVVLAWALPSTASAADDTRSLCIFDIIGSQGDAFALMKQYQVEALKAGVSFQLRAYQDEHRAVEDFRAGQCDVVGITDIPAREFNSFSGSISAIGAVPLYHDLKILMNSLADRRVASRMGNADYQVLGVVPLGGVYLFVNDRAINTVDALRNKRIAALQNHSDAVHMIEYVGARPVPAHVTTVAPLFKTGQVDIAYVPAAAYEVLEMHVGMGDKGGIVRYPLGQFTLQLITRTDTFDKAFVAQSRRIMAGLFDQAMASILRYERSVPEDRWIDLPREAIDGYQEMLRGLRVEIVSGSAASGQALSNVYHPDMLRLLRKIRCHTDPGAVECTAQDKE